MKRRKGFDTRSSFAKAKKGCGILGRAVAIVVSQIEFEHGNGTANGREEAEKIAKLLQESRNSRAEGSNEIAEHRANWHNWREASSPAVFSTG